jgi:hypothetical protein
MSIIRANIDVNLLSNLGHLQGFVSATQSARDRFDARRFVDDFEAPDEAKQKAIDAAKEAAIYLGIAATSSSPAQALLVVTSSRNHRFNDAMKIVNDFVKGHSRERSLQSSSLQRSYILIMDVAISIADGNHEIFGMNAVQVVAHLKRWRNLTPQQIRAMRGGNAPNSNPEPAPDLRRAQQDLLQPVRMSRRTAAEQAPVTLPGIEPPTPPSR